MAINVKTKVAVDPAEIALFRVGGVVREPDCNQKAPVEVGVRLGEVVFGVVNRLVDHFVGAGNRRMVALQRMRAVQPMIPIKSAAPGLPQRVAEQKSQRINLLTILPSIDIGLSACSFKPAFNRVGRMGPKAYAFYTFMDDGREVIAYRKEDSGKVNSILREVRGGPPEGYTGLCYETASRASKQQQLLKNNRIQSVMKKSYSTYCVYWEKGDSDKVSEIDQHFKEIRTHQEQMGNEI
ncbi:MAG: hypothetical protein ABW096_14425 [Candidatus Thiodiazotropha sp.]